MHGRNNVDVRLVVMLWSKLDEIDASRPVSIVAAADESFFSPTSFNVTISFQKLRTYNHYIWGKALAALFLPGNVFHAFSLRKFSFSFFLKNEMPLASAQPYTTQIICGL
jgi:hypothetical protein